MTGTSKFADQLLKAIFLLYENLALVPISACPPKRVLVGT